MKDNSNKLILDLCGGTGSWSKPYRDAGYAVLLLTLPDWDVTKAIIGEDEIHIKNLTTEAVLRIKLDSIYGVLAAPPCTQFSRARTTAKTPRDLKGAMLIVQSCLDIIQAARMVRDSSLKFWAMENPMSMLRQIIGNPPHSFRGWEWGDDHIKFTDLWGYYNMPTKKVKVRPASFDRKKWASPKAPPEYKHLKLDRAAIRAITPPKFAKAFMEANR